MSHLQFNCNRAVWQAASFIWEMMYFGFCHQVRFRITIWRERNPPFKNPALSSLDPGKQKKLEESAWPQKTFHYFLQKRNSSEDFLLRETYSIYKIWFNTMNHNSFFLKKYVPWTQKKLSDELTKSFKMFQHSCFIRYYKTFSQWQFCKGTKLWKRHRVCNTCNIYIYVKCMCVERLRTP